MSEGRDESVDGDNELLATLPWHVGFHNQIADMLRPGDWQPDLVRYNVVQICDHDGRHVCWAKSPEHAAFIVAAVNKCVGSIPT